MKKKIKYIVFTMSATRRAGGLFNSVRNLSEELCKYFEVSVIAGEDEHEVSDLYQWKNLPLTLIKKWKPYSFGFMPSAVSKILSNNPDVLHCHGIWSFNAFACLLVKKLRPRVVLIVSPRGMLDKWALQNSYFKKFIARKIYVNSLIKSSNIVHALCSSESESILKYFPSANVIISPNGISELPLLKESSSKDLNKLTIGYIGRIHHKKGLENVISAIVGLDNVVFKIAGFGEDKYIKELKQLTSKLNLTKYIEFVGPKYQIDKVNFLLDCDLTILPSYSEGLPMAVLESWSYGIPTLITQHCNFDERGNKNFAIKIDPSADSIIDAIKEYAIKKPEYRNFVSNQARVHVDEKYSWYKIAQIFQKKIKNALP